MHSGGGNCHKFRGVMRTVGAASLVADPRAMNKQEIINVIDRALEHRQALREKLAGQMPRVKATVLNLFDEINEKCASAL